VTVFFFFFFFFGVGIRVRGVQNVQVMLANVVNCFIVTLYFNCLMPTLKVSFLIRSY
jgi:hypothetical protein